MQITWSLSGSEEKPAALTECKMSAPRLITVIMMMIMMIMMIMMMLIDDDDDDDDDGCDDSSGDDDDGGGGYDDGLDGEQYDDQNRLTTETAPGMISEELGVLHCCLA